MKNKKMSSVKNIARDEQSQKLSIARKSTEL